MLTYLHVLDFAIIDELELDVRAGLTVLTGETGAGKSILVDALQLIAGGRAGAEVVRHGAQRAEVTATFDLAQAPRELHSWLEDQSVTADQELSVRRVVSADGRSRAYLNGQSVTVQQLREAGNILLDIHGQHEFQTLTRSAGQRELLDAYGRHEATVAEVGIAHRVWLKLLNAALALEGKARDRDARLSLLRYQARELAALGLAAGEFASLSEEATRMANRGRLTESVQGALGQLYEEDQGSAHAALARALQQLKSVAALDPGIAAVVPLVDGAAIQIREAARELQRYLDGQDFDAARQDQVQRRLAAIEELARRNRVPPADLHTKAAELDMELAQLETAESDLAAVRLDLAAALERYREQAKLLSARRATAARALAGTVTSHMQQLGMAGGRFQIDVSPLESAEPQPHGIDQVEFRVTANPGQPLRPLSKVASGGELARLSLAVQVACAGRDSRCMVFDEVDSGIGGAIAEIVGRELRTLAERAQVLCVTHLPQVASQGHHHLRVNKLTAGKTTRTSLADLSADERVEELARMLGGVDISAKARDHAREMLRQVDVRVSGDARKSGGRSVRK
jgi:DNA repair protein RecN (Recombination protein N)